MNMRESILKFAEEFAWEPMIENEMHLIRKEKVIVAGMGGSPLAADLLNAIDPMLNITVRKDYGLPPKLSRLNLDSEIQPFFIAISYSGNTEETIDAFEEAGAQGLARAVIAKGGRLLDRAREEKVAYIQLPASPPASPTNRGESQGGPSSDIQPRMAIGFIVKALAVLMGLEVVSKELTALADILKSTELEEPGRALAKRLRGRIPLIYASSRNRAIAYSWKIIFNETAKIPAFYNVFPELNHNEMTGFDAIDSTRSLTTPFSTLILSDSEDDPRVQKRMEIVKTLYEDRGISAEFFALEGNTRTERIFFSLLLADWTALALAESYGVDPSNVPMVEEFKRLISKS